MVSPANESLRDRLEYYPNSSWAAEGVQAVALSHLLPRAYLLIEDPGWWIMYREDGDVATQMTRIREDFLDRTREGVREVLKKGKTAHVLCIQSQ